MVGPVLQDILLIACTAMNTLPCKSMLIFDSLKTRTKISFSNGDSQTMKWPLSQPTLLIFWTVLIMSPTRVSVKIEIWCAIWILRAKSTPKIEGTPMLHHLWSAGFSFAQERFVTLLPYSQYSAMAFQGEEHCLAICAFTYGCDFHALERSVTFHIFAIKDNIARQQQHKFGENKTLYVGTLEKFMARLLGIIGITAWRITSSSSTAPTAAVYLCSG